MNSNKDIRIIGLTGGIGTGKSTAAEYLRSKGFTHIDADAISHEMTETGSPAMEEISAAFGPGGAFCDSKNPVISSRGELDRKAMAAAVFTDPDKKKALEDILFYHIREEIHHRIREAEEDVLLDVPLLFESGLDSLCDRVILLISELAVRLDRVTKRDGSSREDVLARIRNQMPDEEKISRADFVIDNSTGLMELKRELDMVLKELGKL